MIGAINRGHIVIRGGWSLVAAAFALGFVYLHCHNQVVEASCRLKAMEAARSDLREEASRGLADDESRARLAPGRRK